MYLAIATEMTMPPPSTFFAKLSMSVPPPQKETLTGVLEMIMNDPTLDDNFNRAGICSKNTSRLQ